MIAYNKKLNPRSNVERLNRIILNNEDVLSYQAVPTFCLVCDSILDWVFFLHMILRSKDQSGGQILFWKLGHFFEPPLEPSP